MWLCKVAAKTIIDNVHAETQREVFATSAPLVANCSSPTHPKRALCETRKGILQHRRCVDTSYSSRQACVSTIGHLRFARRVDIIPFKLTWKSFLGILGKRSFGAQEAVTDSILNMETRISCRIWQSNCKINDNKSEMATQNDITFVFLFPP